MKPPKVLTNWVQLVTRIGSLTGPGGGEPDERGDGGADALDRLGAGGHLFHVDAG